MKVVGSERELSELPPCEPTELIHARIASVKEAGYEALKGLVQFLILEEGDGSATLSHALGFDVTRERYGARLFSEPGYVPSFEVAEEHRECFELVFVLHDDGSGFIAFVPKACTTASELLDLCQRHAVGTGS